MISFLPQFPPADASRGTLLLFAPARVAADTGWHLVLVDVLDRVRGRLARAGARRALDRVRGGVLVALGLRLVVDAR